MAKNDGTLIVGSLKDDELRKSIDKLVDYVGNKTNDMAEKFTQGLDKMKLAMKDFAVTQKVSVDVMKQAWRDMSSSFDAMVAAQSTTTSGGRGKGKSYAPDTVGALEQEISALKQERKEMTLNTEQLSKQNTLLEQRKSLLKEQTTANPKSFDDVINMNANSIDEIAKKMRLLKQAKIDPNNAEQVKKLGDEYQKLKRQQAEMMGMNIQHTKSNNYLAQSFGYIRNRIVYALTLGAITSFTKQIYEIRGQYELLERSLGVLVNSFEQGSKVFQELNQMAIESPFTLMELAGAAKQLTAYNFAAKEVVDTTRRLADISAALGVPMERLTYNLGQIRAQTVLTARDARDFANAGLPIVASLAEHFTQLEGKIVTTGDVYDRMSKKMVSYNDVMAVLNKMTDEGGKFFEFQAKQAQTLRVQMANLTLAWNNMLNEIGKSNQGLITLPISGLKALLQNWQSIDRVLKSMIITFGAWKALQMLAIRRQWEWAKYTGATAKQMGWLGNAIKGVGAATKALFTNPWTWAFIGIQAAIDLAHQWWNATGAIHELNQEIRNNSKEASDSMLDYLSNKGNQATRQLAQANKLTAEQGDKAWESLKGQIEQSAMSANSLVTELQAIPDINERVSKSFDYIEKIQKAQAVLQDLKDDSIDFTSDWGWFGMLGEGLTSDLKDFANTIDRIRKQVNALGGLSSEQFSDYLKLSPEYKSAKQEFEDELATTAESINNFLQAYNITDPLQINEILERVRAQIKAKNPEIKGEMAKIFDTSLDQKMFELTNGAVDRNATLWNMFMERLKHNSSSAFQNVNDEWVKSNQKLSNEQQEAVDANLQYFKDSMPMYYDAVAAMVADASKLRIRIGVTFAGENDTNFQKQVKQRIQDTYGVVGSEQFSAYLPTSKDDLISWTKTQQAAIKKLEGANKKYNLDNSAWAKERIAQNDTEIKARKKLLDLFHQQYKEDKRKPEDVVAEALRQEIRLIKEMQSNYDKLRKSGVSNTEAIDLASRGYEATILRINSVLQKFGIDKFNAANFAGKDVRGLLSSLEKQRSDLLASGKVKTSSLQALDLEIQKLTVDAKAYDMKKVTDGLNNELGKLKDEYELAVEFDANPELGDIFADMMGIDKEKLNQLPRTYQQVLAKLQSSIDKEFAKNNITKQFNLESLLNKGAFDEWAKAQGNTLDDSFIKSLDNIRQYANKVRLNETKETTKEWSTLVEKYGDLQARLLKIAKDSSKEQLNIIKKFGNEQDKENASDIAKRLMISQDPETVTRLQNELADLMNRVVQGNQQGINIAKATQNQQQSAESKAYWEDFKDSNLYAMTFEDMSRTSTNAIQMIIAKLEELKNKVKEDPASMKALTDSIKQARKELEGRSGSLTIVNALKEYKEASNGLLQSKRELALADQEVLDAQRGLDEAEEDGTTDDYTNAVDKLAKARQRQAKAQEDVVQGENNVRASTKKLQSGMSTLSGELSNISGLFDTVAKLFSAAGDDETAEAISAISQGFSIMTTVIMGVVAAMILLEASQPWLLAIAATLSVIVGLVSWLSGNNNKDIDKKIKQSEISVKLLENSYKNLERAITNAYGAAQIGARKTAIANKQLQLAELQRQLQLERSRDAKDRDSSKIADLQGRIIDLRNDIETMKDSITNSFLGISSVGDAVNSMVDDIVSALRNGEDAMAKFDESVDDMIANMIKQVFAAKVLGPMFEKIWNRIDKDIQSRGEFYSEQAAAFQKGYDAMAANGGEGYYFYRQGDKWGYTSDAWKAWKKSQEEGVEMMTYEAWMNGVQNVIKENEKLRDEATTPTLNDIRQYAGDLKNMSPELEAWVEALKGVLGELGLIGGKNKNLSNLQQGIQGVTEDTAGAIEAYMNIVSQRVFEQSEYMMQIRDIIIGFDLDVQVATIGQILLQLQASYQVQQAIQSRLDGWSNANGMAIRVEMI